MAIAAANLGAYMGTEQGYFAGIDTWTTDIIRAKPLQIGVCRSNFDVWSMIETSSGVYDWTQMDKIVSILEDNGIDLLMTIPISASWNRAGITCPGIFAPTGRVVGCGSFVTLDLANITEFCTTFATRYKGVIKYYEVWNEPDYGAFWAAETNPVAAEYFALLQAAYTAIKAADPAATVMMGGLAFPQEPPAGLNPGWFDAFLTLGGGNYTDKFNVHVYPAFATIAGTLALMQTKLTTYGLTKKIWVTENSSTGGFFDTSHSRTEENAKAVLMVKNYTAAFSNPLVETMFWHTLSLASTTTGDFELIKPDGTKLAAYTAHAIWSSKMVGATFVTSSTSGSLQTYQYTKAGKTINVLWTTSGSTTVALPLSATSATKTTYMGVRTTLPKRALVAVTTDPIYVEYI